MTGRAPKHPSNIGWARRRSQPLLGDCRCRSRRASLTARRARIGLLSAGGNRRPDCRWDSSLGVRGRLGRRLHHFRRCQIARGRLGEIFARRFLAGDELGFFGILLLGVLQHRPEGIGIARVVVEAIAGRYGWRSDRASRGAAIPLPRSAYRHRTWARAAPWPALPLSWPAPARDPAARLWCGR